MSAAKSAARRRAESSLEKRFRLIWISLDGPPLEREYRFAPPRRCRSDFAHLPSRTLIELEGGAWTGGRHTRGAGFKADLDKYLAATLAAWRVVRLGRHQLTLCIVRQIAKLCLESVIQS